MQKPDLREKMGKEGRQRVIEHFDYRVIAKKFVEIISRRLDIS